MTNSILLKNPWIIGFGISIIAGFGAMAAPCHYDTPEPPKPPQPTLYHTGRTGNTAKTYF